ncbi:hypothetical protein [Burkholderia anthinoferrum]|uniref:Uncharacterized protein n=2 Tax=Burkholderiaceae TaxID=119060 RepID=A0ABU5WED3_9BURK|nr:hypothetical protein [Burkholderia anthinoferrum]MEB2503804.1 hypothetical protein [Burkholderia anthinoferrum]MEB2577447.1 hypothetical protein [Burkholderia anthinoferrum]
MNRESAGRIEKENARHFRARQFRLIYRNRVHGRIHDLHMKRASSCRMPVHADVSGAAPAAAFRHFKKFEPSILII